MPMKKSSKNVDVNTEDNTETKKFKMVSTGKKDWDEPKKGHDKDEEVEVEQEEEHELEEEEEDKLESITYPENKYREEKKYTQSLLDTFDTSGIEQLDKTRLSDISNKDLYRILYLRGLNQENPTIWRGAEQVLRELDSSRQRYTKPAFKNFSGPNNFRGGSRPRDMKMAPRGRKPAYTNY